jgi:hypothetical protein
MRSGGFKQKVIDDDLSCLQGGCEGKVESVPYLDPVRFGSDGGKAERQPGFRKGRNIFQPGKIELDFAGEPYDCGIGKTEAADAESVEVRENVPVEFCDHVEYGVLDVRRVAVG